jgi:predicted nucleotidyltransferase
MGDAMVLDWLLKDLVLEHEAHTVLLYGSRADGSAREDSDYDVAAFGPVTEPFRIARRFNGAYLDVWVYPESELQISPGVEHLRLRGSKILLQRDSEADAFLSRLEQYFLQGPRPLRPGEGAARKVWAHKTLARAVRGDPEGNYRRLELIQVLLENYFHVRGRWYQGSNKSLLWLQQFDPPAFRSFCKALEPGADIHAFAELVQLMVGEEDA